eukprot:scaffold179_cov368-Prasinococcus_capsulatus_cf.AAC.4
MLRCAPNVGVAEHVLRQGLVMPEAPAVSLVCCVGRECKAVGESSLITAPANGKLKCMSNSFVGLSVTKLLSSQGLTGGEGKEQQARAILRPGMGSRSLRRVDK